MVDYIYDTLVVSVPALCAWVADELVLIFYDTDAAADGGGGGGGGGGTGGSAARGEKVIERFVVSFDVSSGIEASRVLEGGDVPGVGISNGGGRAPSEDVQAMVQELQRSLRDVLLKIISMEGATGSLGRKWGRTNFSGTTRFQLCLHCRTATDGEGEGGACSSYEVSRVNP